jgi:hypothetical protein
MVVVMSQYRKKYRQCAILTKISDQSVEKQKSYAILNDRLETFDRYCLAQNDRVDMSRYLYREVV